MSWFSLNKAMGTNYTVDPGDIVNTKTALNHLGYYDVPPHRGIDDWTDDSMFNGIKAFQKDNGLKVDGFMRPGGPTERAINADLEEKSTEGSPTPSGPGNPSPSTSQPGSPYDGYPLWKQPFIWLDQRQRENERRKEEERRRTNPTPPAGGRRG